LKIYLFMLHIYRLTSVQLDVASENGTGEMATSVEQCQCPRGYEGTSCEDCMMGYYRSHRYPYLGRCSPCQCYGHADECDLNTGVCLVRKHSYWHAA